MKNQDHRHSILSLIWPQGKSCWLTMMAGLALATVAARADSVQITSLSPSDYICACSNVTATVHVSFDGSASRTLYYQTSSGTSGTTNLWTSDTDVVLDLPSEGATGSEFTIEAWLEGGYGVEGLWDGAAIYLVSVTAVTPYVLDPVTQAIVVPTWVLMPGTEIGFWVTLSTDAGNGPYWVPPCLAWSGATPDELGHWAYGTYYTATVADVTASIGCSAAAAEPLIQYMLTIRAVTFAGEGFADVMRDATGNAYPTPHWAYDPHDDVTPYSIYPVQYYRSATPILTAVFDVSPADYAQPVHVRIAECLDADTYTPEDGHLTLEHVPLRALDNSVCLNNCELHWQWSLDGVEWFDADAGDLGQPTTHPIYQTLNQPAPHYHTSVDVACSGVNATDEAGVMTMVWCTFAGKALYTVDTNLMRFFAEGNNTPNDTVPFNQALFTAAKHFDGRCEHWAFFLTNVLNVHGIGSVIKIFTAITALNYHCMEVADSLVGQGGTTKNPNADSEPVNWTGRFDLHVVVLYGTTALFDPSYGFSCTTEDTFDPQGDLVKRWEDDPGNNLKCLWYHVPDTPYDTSVNNFSNTRSLKLVDQTP